MPTWPPCCNELFVQHGNLVPQVGKYLGHNSHATNTLIVLCPFSLWRFLIVVFVCSAADRGGRINSLPLVTQPKWQGFQEGQRTGSFQGTCLHKLSLIKYSVTKTAFLMSSYLHSFFPTCYSRKAATLSDLFRWAFYSSVNHGAQRGGCHASLVFSFKASAYRERMMPASSDHTVSWVITGAQRAQKGRHEIESSKSRFRTIWKELWKQMRGIRCVQLLQMKK